MLGNGMLENNEEIKAACEKVFPGCEVHISSDRIEVTPHVENLKFPDLNRLSEALGTDQIDLEKGEHHPGYSYSSWTYESSWDSPSRIIVYRGPMGL